MNNGDEYLKFDLKFNGKNSPEVIAIGNFHKTLPHNVFGEVDPDAYEVFCELASGAGNFEHVPLGRDEYRDPPIPSTGQAPFTVSPAPIRSDKLNNPQAGRSHDKLTGPPSDYSMSPAPSVLSASTAAEMTELQWMALLRDMPFSQWKGDPLVTSAIADIKAEYQKALDADEPGGLKLGVDLPEKQNKLDIHLSTLFRCGLEGESRGPVVSQFFLHDIAYGSQIIRQRVRPYLPGTDFLTDHGSWLRAQSTGLDEYGRGYAGDNLGADGLGGGIIAGPDTGSATNFRPLTTMRDIARFVNKDALHQAYFNAAVLCLNWGVPFEKGTPYNSYRRQTMFGTFGGPDLLTRVSEVAGRALAVVWRQKWEVHRRLRPEAYGGLMQMQSEGYDPGTGVEKRNYGLPAMVFNSAGAGKIRAQQGNYFLPIAFSAGSPPHPSYGAGHATVAGACVTVLKAWLDEKQPIEPFIKKAHHPETDSPLYVAETDSNGKLVAVAPNEAKAMTVEGELNKLACNVAMGRSMGGVHWRSDNTRSLRLGEQIAAELLRSESMDYAERATNATAPLWTFTSFNGNKVEISEGKVRVNGAIVDPKAGPL